MIWALLILLFVVAFMLPFPKSKNGRKWKR